VEAAPTGAASAPHRPGTACASNAAAVDVSSSHPEHASMRTVEVRTGETTVVE